MSGVKQFTLEEANRTLPYLRRVVADLVRDYHAWQETLAKYEVAAARRRPAENGTPGEEGDAERLERHAATLAGAIESYLAEISAVGAEAKGFAEGLIDFPGELDGRQIRWCWMLGEPAVEHGHDAETGFSGRQPVDGLATAKQE
jgi:hypothetical protein